MKITMVNRRFLFWRLKDKILTIGKDYCLNGDTITFKRRLHERFVSENAIISYVGMGNIGKIK